MSAAVCVRLEVAEPSDDPAHDRSGRVATIWLDRPPTNLMDSRMRADLVSVAREAAVRDDVRAVVIDGGPRVFSAGDDVEEMVTWGYREAVRHSSSLQDAMDAVAAIPKPTVAAISGYAIGAGLELALACDFRVAGDNVKLAMPETGIGIIPGGGGTQRLTRLVGISAAKDLIYSGRYVDAAQAHAMGLVERVVLPADVRGVAWEWARELAVGAPRAIAAVKHAIEQGASVGLAAGLELERLQFTGLFATEDRWRGMRSYLDSGPGRAEFTGN